MSLFEFVEKSKGNVHPANKPSLMPSRVESEPLQHRTTRDIDCEAKLVLRAENRMPDKRIFLIAFVWINENLSELLQLDWTKTALFRRGRFSYPYGNWGIAWFGVWGKDDVHTDIDKRTGAIRFTFRATDGRIISQAAYPVENQNKL